MPAMPGNKVGYWFNIDGNAIGGAKPCPHIVIKRRKEGDRCLPQDIKLSQQFENAGKLQLTADYVINTDELPGTLDSAQFYNKSRESSNLYAGYDNLFFRSDLVYTQSWSDNIDMFVNGFYRNKKSDGFYSDSRSSAKSDEVSTVAAANISTPFLRYARRPKLTIASVLLRMVPVAF